MYMLCGSSMNFTLINSFFYAITWNAVIAATSIMLLFVAIGVCLFFLWRILSLKAKLYKDTKIRELSNQAVTDDLTGLFNRRYAKKFFEKNSNKNGKTCLAMVDIDDFKSINDSYGHNCGDDVLVYVSSFLKNNIRNEDIAVRWGGEEFLIIVMEEDIQEAFVLLDSLRERLAQERFQAKERSIRVTITVGISRLTDHVDNSILECDLKMYKGKSKGKNIVVI